MLGKQQAPRETQHKHNNKIEPTLRRPADALVSVQTQRRVTRQLVQHRPQYIALRQITAHTRSAEQQKLQTAQKYRAVAANSVLRGETQWKALLSQRNFNPVKASARFCTRLSTHPRAK